MFHFGHDKEGAVTSQQPPEAHHMFRFGHDKPEQTLQKGRDAKTGHGNVMAYFDDGRQPGRHGGDGPPRRKSLLIGINYVGSTHQLEGCHQDVDNVREFLNIVRISRVLAQAHDSHEVPVLITYPSLQKGYPQDQRSQVIMRDDNYTDPDSNFWPNGHNMLAAMQWLVSEPGTINFLHYSGHGSQVRSRPDEYRASGFDDTIVPFDFERNGQIPSSTLHQTLVTCLPPNSTLFIVFDCCHSGSALELPYVYRSDEDGNVNKLDNVEAGIRLVGAASHLIQGGFLFNKNKVGEAKQLLAGATDFFKGLSHKQEENDQWGLGESDTMTEYASEGAKNVWMYSGCRDNQTSEDASIAGSHVGAMSWAFLKSMREIGMRQSYIQVLQNTRRILKGQYTQVPQLSVGYEQDLNYAIRF